MKRALAVFLLTLALLGTLTACGKPLVGTVTFKAYERAENIPQSGYVTHYRNETYSGTCYRTSTVNKRTTSTSYSCSKTKRVRYERFEHWIRHIPACYRIGVEYEDEKYGGMGNTTRCIPSHVWNTLDKGSHYDSETMK